MSTRTCLAVVVLACGLVLPTLGAAQTPVVPQLDSVAWHYIDADATASVLTRFEVCYDTTACQSVTATVARFTPTAAQGGPPPAGSSVYKLLVPTLTGGSHTVGVRGCNASLCSTLAVFAGGITVAPPPIAAPRPVTNVRVSVDVPPPPPTTPLDAFTRANGPTLGGNWTNQTTVVPGIANNLAIGQASPSRQCAFWNATQVAADQFAQVTVGTISATQYPYVIVRAAGTTPTTYGHYTATAEPGFTAIAKLINGVRTQLTQIDGVPWVTGDLLRLEVRGTTLKVFRNGIQVGSDQPTGGQLTTGRPGICLWGTGTLDDFVAGPLQ